MAFISFVYEFAEPKVREDHDRHGEQASKARDFGSFAL